MRPAYITPEDIVQWDQFLETDTLTPNYFKKSPELKEIFYAGFWLMQELDELGAEDHIIVQIQYTHGSLSYNNDPWKVAKELLDSYKDGTLTFVDEEEVNEKIEKIEVKDVLRDEKVQN